MYNKAICIRKRYLSALYGFSFAGYKHSVIPLSYTMGITLY